MELESILLPGIEAKRPIVIATLVAQKLKNK